jgi:hypothetical protein
MIPEVGFKMRSEDVEGYVAFLLTPPPILTWNPKEDITTLELAKCIPFLLLACSGHTYYDDIPPECKRHFETK